MTYTKLVNKRIDFTHELHLQWQRRASRGKATEQTGELGHGLGGTCCRRWSGCEVRATTKMGCPEYHEARGSNFRAREALRRRGEDERRPAVEVIWWRRREVEKMAK